MSNHAPFVPWMHSLLDRMKELYNKPNARTIAEALPDITGAMHYRGTKAAVADLPSSGNATGDFWHITADGSEWAWDGSEWQDLGSTIDLSAYRTAAAQDLIDGAQNTAIAAKYTKPSGGIPKSDLANDVQTSLGKADTALQSVPSGYATETWVTNKGYQTAAQVQTAISGVRQLPVVSASDNGKFLRVESGTWAAATVPSAETASF